MNKKQVMKLKVGDLIVIGFEDADPMLALVRSKPDREQRGDMTFSALAVESNGTPLYQCSVVHTQVLEILDQNIMDLLAPIAAQITTKYPDGSRPKV